MTTIALKETKQRIQMVDALRGFALLGIVLFHNLEHFNFWSEHSLNPEWAKALDSYVWSLLAFIFSGKAYGIFCILFGFSFWVQYANQKARGNHFAGRFAWRMVLLFSFGFFHSLFYNGDILGMYALLGIVLIMTRKWSDKAVLILAFICILQPIDWIKFLIVFQDPNWEMAHPSWVLNDKLLDARLGESYWYMIWMNLRYGFASNVCWIWNYGRLCQATGLFLIGMTLSRRQMFSEIKPVFWLKALVCSIPTFLILDWFKIYITTRVITSGHSELADIILNLYVCLPQTVMLLSVLILAWHYSSYLRKALALLAPYGRTSLTNYITQSIIGTYICFEYGLGLYKYTGATLSALIGIAIVLVQVLISHWWLHRYKQGPMEWLWKQATWIGSNRKPKTLITPEEESD